jgi:hypothetical protein
VIGKRIASPLALVALVASIVPFGVKPKGAPAGSSGARISAARNEFESFQVAISAGDTPLRGVNVSLASPLTGSRGSIPARNVTIHREAYLDIDTPSDLERSRGR